MASSIQIRLHPFNSPESYKLVKDLESDLAAFYPDWEQLSQPNYVGNPRPTTPEVTTTLGTPKTPPGEAKEITPFSDLIPSKTSSTTSDEPGLLFFVAFDNSLPVGCVALRHLTPHASQSEYIPHALPPQLSSDKTYVEVKRMFIAHSHRGQGLSKTLLAHAEKYAREELRVDIIVLEVGLRQKAAVALYRSLGYKERAMYGEYVGMEVEAGGDSICMEKSLRLF
jgi:GNAT superfamily N-acetyltransferase